MFLDGDYQDALVLCANTCIPDYFHHGTHGIWLFGWGIWGLTLRVLWMRSLSYSCKGAIAHLL